MWWDSEARKIRAGAVPAQWREVLHGWPGLDASRLEALALETAGRTSG